MDKIKLKAGSAPDYPVDKDTFDRITYRKAPYYQTGTDGKMRYYAVCPACDNPVQLVGLIQTVKSQKNPYAKHYESCITHHGVELGRYNRERYYWCPYSKQSNKRLTPTDKVPMSAFANDILDHIRQYFDRIIYFIGTALGIHISNQQAKRMLEDYVASEGYLYAGASLMNIPWIVAYTARAQSLLEVRLRDPNDELAQALTKKVQEVTLNQSDYIKRHAGTPYIILTHCLMEHRRACQENTLTEWLTWVVTLEKYFQETVIYEQRLDFDYGGYQRLLNYKRWNTNESLLEIASKVLAHLPTLHR